MANLLTEILADARGPRFGLVAPQLAEAKELRAFGCMFETEARRLGLVANFTPFVGAEAHYERLISTTALRMEQDVVKAAVILESQHPEHLRNSMPYLHVPANNLFIEWTEQARVDAHLAEGKALTKRPWSYSPERVGVQIECADPYGRSGIARWFWSRPSKDFPTSFGQVEIEFDFNNVDFASARGTKWEMSDKASRNHALYSYCTVGITPEVRETTRRLGQLVESQHYIENRFASEVTGDWPFLVALLQLLNARQTTSREAMQQDELSRVNRKREKRGQIPIRPYQLLRMNLTGGPWKPKKLVGGPPRNNARPRQHEVLAHTRALKNGGRVQVKSYVRGDRELGRMPPRFRLVGA